MSLCYSPSDILFYVKDGNSHWPVKYPDDEHAIALNDVQTVVNNLKILKHAIGTGIKTKIKNKI
jgi:hypothetical protein